MLKHTLLSPEGILILEPSTLLEAADFEDLAREIDPYIAEHGTLVYAKAFPGWSNLEAAIACSLAAYRKLSPKDQKIGGSERQWSAGGVTQIRRSSFASGSQALFGIRV
jgi:hypothetical protein